MRGARRLVLLLACLLPACEESVTERSIGTLIRPTDVAVARLPGGDGAAGYALVANSGDDSLAVADIAALQFLDFVPGNTLRRNPLPNIGRLPVAVAVSPDQSRAFVLNALGPDLAVVDLSSFEIIGRVPVGAQPDDLLVTDLGGRTVALISRPADGVVELYDLTAEPYPQLGSFALTGWIPRGLALCDEGRRLFVADGGNTAVVELSMDPEVPTRPRLAARYEVGGVTARLAADPACTFLYAVKSVDNRVAVVDLALGEWIDANPETVALDEAEGTEHRVDLAGGSVPLDVQIVQYDYLLSATGDDEEDEAQTTEAVTVALTTDYDGYVRGYDLVRDPHKIFDTVRDTTVAVTDVVYRTADGRTVELPRADYPSLAPRNADDPDDPGIEVFFRVTRTESWSVIYDGLIGGDFQSTRGSFDLNGRRFLAPDADFLEDDILVGDVLIVDSPPVGTECPLTEQEVLEPVELEIVEVEETVLHFAETDLPLAECFAERELSFSLRTSGSFAVNGSVSGFKGRAYLGVGYDNLLVRFTIEPPESAGAGIESGAGWVFGTSSGVEALVFDGGSIPGGLTFSAGDADVTGDELFFVPNSSYGGISGSRGGLLQLDAQTFEIQVRYY